MAADNVVPRRDALQFDHALAAGAPAGSAPSATITCANCGTSITTEYYHVGGHVVCEACRATVQASIETPRGWKPFVKAALFGVAAAIAGAIVYYAVMAIANLEIGIVAILIGYMVGYMIRKATAGRGGRRFQILALVLTYWSVGLAYTPMAFKGLDEKKPRGTAVTDSVGATRPDSAKSTASPDSSLTRAAEGPQRGTATKELAGREFLVGLGALAFLTFALPLFAVFGSLPAGLLSGIIILIGLRQAWRMTGAPVLSVTGPYKVGGGPATASA